MGQANRAFSASCRLECPKLKPTEQAVKLKGSGQINRSRAILNSQYRAFSRAFTH